LNLDGVKIVNRENIRHLRKGKNTSRMMKHWNYAELFEKLDSKLIDAGVQINKLNPTYTSQRCSCCGWVRKGNRKKKQFKCDKCSFECDADLNASINLSLPLLPIGKQQRLKQLNRTGFYWNVERQDFIVPVTLKTN
jgi:transposase